MKLLKNIKQNFFGSPYSTRDGLFYSLTCSVILLLLTQIPAFNKIMQGNVELIYSIIGAIATGIIGYFGQKRDNKTHN